MSEKPNIILIMTDQQRLDTIAAWGNDHMTTPAMDRLAAAGTSFRQAFCPGATCVASRAAIFTGMYPHTTGTYSFNSWAEHRNWVQDLADGGYFCINIGKMHFTPRDVAGGFHERVIVENPTSRARASGGADDDWGRFLAHHGLERPNGRDQTDPEWKQKYQGIPWHYEERFHSDFFIGDSALGWIDQNRHEGPVFLQIGFTGPHEPWDPMPRHLEMYRDRPMPPRSFREGELADKPPQQEAHKRSLAQAQHESIIDMYTPTEEAIAEMRRHYYAKVTTVDEKLGEVLDALEKTGMLDNSLVIFCSDHGELLGDHTMAYKWLMYDQIVHVPLIICDRRAARGGSGAGASVGDLVSLMDLGPTVLEAAGIEPPTYLEGRSLLPYAEGDSNQMSPRQYVYCEDNYLVMMRSQTHKLVYYIGQQEGELYDLATDPEELWNLWESGKHRSIKQELLSDLLAWMAGSTYYNAGYRRDRSRNYRMRWPGDGDFYLHGGHGQNLPRPSDLL